MNVNVDFNSVSGKIKPMHCVNNGPVPGRPTQPRSNFDTYKAARIPYARNHDASEWIDFGGEHVVDIYSIFPDFDADPYDPASYDFICTDDYTKVIVDAGTEVFYRLGARIEHERKKYRTIMPKDFHKWAVICEHVILHYNEGWADGFHYNIKYWEIWNEADLDDDDSEHKRNWSGTAQDYYEFYEVAATYLKERFPHLMIGGPSIANRVGKWYDDFLDHMTKDGKKVPIDFLSWHWYGADVAKMINRAHTVKEKLVKAGYTEAESILNEWNYVCGWREKFVDSIRVIISMKGAAFTTACMLAAQNDEAIDMLMYYEASPCTFNGMWNFYTMEPIKGYWSLYSFADLYDLGSAVKTESDDKDVYAVGAKDEKGNKAVLVCYYTDEADREEKTVTVDLNGYGDGKTELYRVDDDHDYTLCETQSGNTVTFNLKPNTFVMLKSI